MVSRLDRLLDRPAFWLSYALLLVLLAIVCATLALTGAPYFLLGFAVNMACSLWAFYKFAYYSERA